jgi:hypothetical protein
MDSLAEVERVRWRHHFDMVSSQAEPVHEIVQCQLDAPTGTRAERTDRCRGDEDTQTIHVVANGQEP